MHTDSTGEEELDPRLMDARGARRGAGRADRQNAARELEVARIEGALGGAERLRPDAGSAGAAPWPACALAFVSSEDELRTPSTWSACSRSRSRSASRSGVNGLPDRLDLRGEHVPGALRAGVRIVCSTDAHSVRGLGNMALSVATARGGWATAAHVVKAQPLRSILDARQSVS
jgi:hypothetical protein